MRVVGEVFDGDPSMIAFFEGGRQQWDGVDDKVDVLFDFPMFYAIRGAFARGGVDALQREGFAGGLAGFHGAFVEQDLPGVALFALLDQVEEHGRLVRRRQVRERLDVLCIERGDIVVRNRAGIVWVERRRAGRSQYHARKCKCSKAAHGFCPRMRIRGRKRKPAGKRDS